MTKTEIILETVEYYKNNPRGLDKSEIQCCYYSDGKMCAVGRCLKNPEFFKNDTVSIKALFENKMLDDSHFKNEYQNNECNFWRELQKFHDTGAFWSAKEVGNELTILGLYILEKFLETWRNK